MKIITFDIKPAYLHTDLDQVEYMYYSEGFDDGSGLYMYAYSRRTYVD